MHSWTPPTGSSGLPFVQALSVLSTVISVSDGVDGGRLRAQGARHGPWQSVRRGAEVWFCSDEHLTFAPASPLRVGDRIRVVPRARRPHRRLSRVPPHGRPRRGGRTLARRPAVVVSGTPCPTGQVPVGWRPEQEADMADAVPFTIGSDATCTDGPCGQVDAGGRRSGQARGHSSGDRAGPPGRAGPVGPARTTRGGITRGAAPLHHVGVREPPLAEETDFLPGGSGYADYAAHEAYYWPYYGLGAVGSDPGTASARGIVTHDSLPVDEVGVRRGEPSTPPTVRSAGSRASSWSRRTITSRTSSSRRGMLGAQGGGHPDRCRHHDDGGISINLTKQRGGGPAAGRRGRSRRLGPDLRTRERAGRARRRPRAAGAPPPPRPPAGCGPPGA